MCRGNKKIYFYGTLVVLAGSVVLWQYKKIKSFVEWIMEPPLFDDNPHSEN